MTPERERRALAELLDEESLAVLAILLAVALEFGFGFAKTVTWWAGLIAGPSALAALVTLFRLRPTHIALVRLAAWVVRPRERRDEGAARRRARPAGRTGE
jgi:hypothetical protein